MAPKLVMKLSPDWLIMCEPFARQEPIFHFASSIYFPISTNLFIIWKLRKSKKNLFWNFSSYKYFDLQKLFFAINLVLVFKDLSDTVVYMFPSISAEHYSAIPPSDDYSKVHCASYINQMHHSSRYNIYFNIQHKISKKKLKKFQKNFKKKFKKFQKKN